jgi:hypothetical protein
VLAGRARCPAFLPCRRAAGIANSCAPAPGADDDAWREKSECMRRKTDSIQRNTYGQQDWKFAGKC